MESHSPVCQYDEAKQMGHCEQVKRVDLATLTFPIFCSLSLLCFVRSVFSLSFYSFSDFVVRARLRGLGQLFFILYLLVNSYISTVIVHLHI